MNGVDMALEPIHCTPGEDGRPVFGAGPPLVGFSLGLLYEGTADPRWLTIEAGLVVLRGATQDGEPVEYRYRAIGFRPVHPEANEGGVLVCERVA